MHNNRIILRIIPGLFLLILFLAMFWEIIIQGYVALPSDTLIGAYFPWLNHKWGYAVGVPVKNALLSDAFSTFFIYKKQLVDSLQHLQLPLWNKYILSGTPFIAPYHTAVFFPANILLLLPGHWGWNLFLIASSLTSAICLYLYLNRYVSSSAAKLAGSVVFAFAGPMTTWFEFGTGVWAAAIMPLILYLIDNYLFDRKTWSLPCISLSFASLLLVGHAQIDVYLSVLVGLYLLYCLGRRQITPGQLTALLFAFLLGLAISMIQIIPTYSLYQKSIRQSEAYSSTFRYGLIDLQQLIRLYIPDFFGHPVTGNHYGSFIYHEYASFIGTLSLPLFLPLIKKHFRLQKSGFFLTVLFMSLFLIVYHPVSRFIFSLPLPLLTYSSASRIYFITSLASGVLVAFALEQYQRNFHYRRYSAIISVLLSLIVFALLKVTPEMHYSVAFRNSLLPLALLSVMFIVSIVRLPRLLIALVILLVICFDMGRYFRKYNPFNPGSLVFPTTPTIEFLQSQPKPFRIARQYTNLLPPNTWSYYGLESVEGYDPLRPLGYAKFFHLLENEPLSNSVSRYSELQDVSLKCLDSLNVLYFLALEPESPDNASDIYRKLVAYGHQPVFREGKVTVFKSPTAKDRAYFLNDVVDSLSSQEIENRLQSADFDPRRTALLTEDLPENPAFAPGAEVIAINHDSSRIEIETSSPETAFLVLADSYDPDWVAQIDGHSSHIYQVNLGLRGILMPAGTHKVVFEYQPASFNIGARITIISLLVCVAWLSYGLRNRS